MAEKKKQENSLKEKTDLSPKPQGSEKNNKFKFYLFAFLTALAIIIVVVGGAFYIVLHNNIGGIADKYRGSIKNVPVISWMLPKLPNPDDPKNLTDKEIRSKYTDMKDDRDEYKKQLDEANKKLSKLQKIKEQYDKLKTETDKSKADADAKQKQLDDYKKKIDEIVASGDKTGFKEYFSKVSPDVAKEVYSEIMKEQKTTEEAANFAKLYSAMEPDAAAKILEQMGKTKMDLIVNILKNMSSSSASNIIAEMSSSFAATLTEKLSDSYLGSKTTTGQ
jgi:flagellar motility protein MotE (MotC chaperone)